MCDISLYYYCCYYYYHCCCCLMYAFYRDWLPWINAVILMHCTQWPFFRGPQLGLYTHTVPSHTSKLKFLRQRSDINNATGRRKTGGLLPDVFISEPRLPVIAPLEQRERIPGPRYLSLVVVRSNNEAFRWECAGAGVGEGDGGRTRGRRIMRPSTERGERGTAGRFTHREMRAGKRKTEGKNKGETTKIKRTQSNLSMERKQMGGNPYDAIQSWEIMRQLRAGLSILMH